ncbi:hypothetical protein RclHR1_00910036 [Rhizophagus clarus]|uniref:Crinkler effector protein N-terminal domain-containing protein n=1 Tax=Rhizophagus clarus TaxID=94130 RepID=A0A2Z6S3F8_9GLOM|nr:hypothetical protein RclHR1_00910036 [Rhizophagus clarus]
MPITLFCLVKGNTTASAFEVDIEKDKSISKLKEAIKAKNPQTFANVDAKDLKLWKVPISDDHDDQLWNLTLEDSDELLAINEIGDYWTEKPPKKHIHVIVEQPASTATSNREQELLEEVASLRALLKKSVAFDVVVSPKRTKGFKWTINIEQATLDGLKEHIRKMEKPPALENDGAVLNIVNDSGKYSPLNDQDLREMLQLFVSIKNLKFTVFIETPSKAFSDWTFSSVCQLYGLNGETEDPTMTVFPNFSCGNVKPSQESLEGLMAELKSRLDNTPISLLSVEATKSLYVYSYLLAGANNFKGKFEIRPQKVISGPNGHGPLDFAIDLCQTAKTVGVTEVKKDDFVKGVAQCAVQLESSLSYRKRKADEMEERTFGRVFGIVTDAEKFYFMECSMDDQDRPSFKLSKPVTVVYEDNDLQTKVEKVLEHIVWLLEEAQKPDSALNVKERVIKRVRSGELPKIMSSELELLKQRITELEAKNDKLEAENAELRKENTEIRDLRIKLSVSDAEIAELKRRNNEFLRANKEYNERRDAENAKLKAENVEFRDRLTKVEQNQSLIDNSSNTHSSNFNSVADQAPTVIHHEKPLVDTLLPEDKETVAFLNEEHKKKVSNEIRQRNREKKLQRESSTKDLSEDACLLINPPPLL